MINATAGVKFTLAVALSFTALVRTHTASAQVVRGVVKAKEGGRVLDRSQIIAQNDEGRSIGIATTDESGRFYLALKALGKPFSITIKRLGIIPTTSSRITLAPVDTADMEFLVDEAMIAMDTQRTTARIGANERKLLDAERRGWKIFMPIEVERHRDHAQSLNQLLRSWGNTGIILPSRDGDCVRSSRNNRCMTLVIDDHPVGLQFFMDPREIYFLAVVQASESRILWGEAAAPNGAISIYTRMRGDKYR